MKNLIILVLSSFLFLASGAVWAGAVNINTADAAALAANIKGVGIKKAEDIVAYREQHGEFNRAEDLAKVHGIGQKTVEKNLDNLEVE